MERITSQRHAEPIAHALTWVPIRVLEVAGADIFCGDPVFAGLHRETETGDGRSYRDTAHACFPHHVGDRRVTLVFPGPPPWTTVIHELGHALDWHIQERTGRSPTFAPVSAYAETDRMEAFAEAFVAWFYPPGQWYRYDAESRAFFDRVASGGW